MTRNEILLADDAALGAIVEWQFTRDTGNGGQKRNKTSSAVQVHLPQYDLSAADCTERSQYRNRHNALRKLRLSVAYGIRGPVPENPPDLVCALTNSRYPLVLAQILDIMDAAGYDLKKSADALGVSVSKLNKFLYRDTALWQHLTRIRTERGLPMFFPPGK